jgi:hypothetical protein
MLVDICSTRTHVSHIAKMIQIRHVPAELRYRLASLEAVKVRVRPSAAVRAERDSR